MNKEILLWQKDIPYALESPGQFPAVTPFPVTGSKGAVLICPGGGYDHLAAHEGAPVAEMFNTYGISAFVLRYRLHPCHSQAPLNDALRAIRMLRSYGYEKVAILGFSAGGHLACSAATLYPDAILNASDPIDRYSSKPDHLISCYSVVSFVSNTHTGSLLNLLSSESGNISLQRYFSAELHIKKDTSPAFIWHTAGDVSVPPENSLALAAAYARLNKSFELHIYPGGHHGMGLATDDPVISGWSSSCADWLIRNGYKA